MDIISDVISTRPPYRGLHRKLMLDLEGSKNEGVASPLWVHQPDFIHPQPLPNQFLRIGDLRFNKRLTLRGFCSLLSP